MTPDNDQQAQPQKRWLLRGTVFLLVIGAGALAIRAALVKRQTIAAQEAAPAVPPRIEALPSGGVVVKLSPEEIKLLDLQSQPVSSNVVADQTLLHGVVLDPLPYLELEGKQRSAQAQVESAALALAASRAELGRLEALHASDQGASEKALQEARAKVYADEAAQAAVRAEAMRSKAAWSQQGPFGETTGLASFQQVLLRFDLPQEMPAPKGTLDLVTPTGSQRIHLVGTAASASPLTGGVAVLARAEGRGMRPGMPVDAWASAGSKKQSLLVSESALLRADGLVWVYLTREDGRYERRPVRLGFPTPQGVTVDAGLHDGDSVIVRGAQSLLAEELRSPSSGGD
jgi:hypothetical protein